MTQNGTSVIESDAESTFKAVFILLREEGEINAKESDEKTR